MEIFDQAQETDALFLKLALDRQRHNAPAGESALICEECEEEIPEARRIASPGCTLCIECARELQNKRLR